MDPNILAIVIDPETVYLRLVGLGACLLNLVLATSLREASTV